MSVGNTSSSLVPSLTILHLALMVTSLSTRYMPLSKKSERLIDSSTSVIFPSTSRGTLILEILESRFLSPATNTDFGS